MGSGLGRQSESISIYFAQGDRRNFQEQNQGKGMPLEGVTLVTLNLGKHLNYFLYNYIMGKLPENMPMIVIF